MRAPLVGFLLLALLVPSASGAERAGSLAAANGRIVFVTGNGMASMNPDGSGVWGLMLGGSDGEPAWSRDGSRLAVAVRWPGIEGITIMDPQGWINRQRITTGIHDRDPAWSPDGRTIVFSRDGDLMLVPAAGGTPTPLTAGDGFDLGPEWSPDGKQIAFARRSEVGASIWLLDVATGLAARVPRSEHGTSPSWSPQGQLTYVESNVAYVAAADGSRTQLVSGVDWDTPIAWAPDGQRLLFVRGGGIWVADRTGRELGRLVQGYAPAWQPLPPAPAGCTLWGTASADILVGTRGADVVCGLDGNDTVIGLDGDDVLLGGAGDDWVAGGQGFDKLYGGDGQDRLDSRDGGSDLVIGNGGYDTGLLERIDARLGIERRRFDANIAAWRPVHASGTGIPDPAERVVDGRADDFWNSGGWPPQWIEIDLLWPTDVARIRLVAGPQQRGVTHLVLGKGPATRGAYRLLRVVRGPTAARQGIVLSPARPWRGIRKLRIETRAGNQGAEWVSWHEIEVYAPVRR